MSKKVIIILTFVIILLNQAFRLNANDDTYINSSNITYNEKKNIIELAENSKINFKNTNILIDKGIIDYNKNEFEVFGSFYLYEELTILSGENLKGNTSLDIFTAENVSYIYNNDLKIDSNNLKKNSNYIFFYNNFLTPCDLDGYFNCPTWSLKIDKTEYDIDKDKFTHYDTFLQIADYKLFYLPYFTHYGVSAPRQKGFLTPKVEFTIGGEQGIITPYYYPISDSSDVTFNPKIFLNENFELLENFDLKTNFNIKTSGGNTSINIDNFKRANKTKIDSSIRLNTRNIIDKNKIISASGIFTNDVSTTRSGNEDPIAFEDIYVRFEKFNLLSKSDYLKTELSSVESYDSSNSNSIPISPSVNYINQINFNNKELMNELDFIILKRNSSNANSPSEIIKLNISNKLIDNHFYKDFTIFNNIEISNSFNEYIYNNDVKLNGNSYKSSLIFSSDVKYNNFQNIDPGIKLIFPVQLLNTNKSINEDSKSITFNFQNQLSENRYFGYDLFDNSPRLVFLIDNNLKVLEQNVSLKINQTYDFRSNNSYSNAINQKSRLSDYAIEAQTNYKNIIFEIDARLDQENFSKKEMNYSLSYAGPISISLNYHETQSKAFKDLSNDTQTLDFSMSKKINDNISISYLSNMDIKNNYDPYKSSLNIGIFDECSQLDLTYSNTRFNDNFNTQPKETVGISFSMDYLGFFGYEESTNLFFAEENK